MLWWCREEEYYEAEKVLGRDVNDVFSIKSRAGAALKSEAAQSILEGAKRFVSESELKEMKASMARSRRHDDSTEPMKPLAQALLEQREAKEQARAEREKLLKQGKNRPLDEDEALFLESIAEAEALQQRTERELERSELEAFHTAMLRQQQREAQKAYEKEKEDGKVATTETEKRKMPEEWLGTSEKRRNLSARPVIARVIRKRGDAKEHGVRTNDSTNAIVAENDQKSNEVPKHASSTEVQPEGGLAGLLSEYDSDTS